MPALDLISGHEVIGAVCETALKDDDMLDSSPDMSSHVDGLWCHL